MLLRWRSSRLRQVTGNDQGAITRAVLTGPCFVIRAPWAGQSTGNPGQLIMLSLDLIGPQVLARFPLGEDKVFRLLCMSPEKQAPHSPSLL